MIQENWLRKPDNDLTVIFIHGFNSSEECWRNSNGTYWPELLKMENSFSSIGIYVFSYRTSISSGYYSLGDVVDSLKEYLRLDEVLKHSSIIFVCHSMGGIVVRRFLVSQQLDLLEDGLKEVGLFLVASPSLGSNYANMLSIVSRFIGHTQADALRFSQSNTWLNDLDKDFRNLKESSKLRINGKELIEDLPIILKGLIKKQVVEPFSGSRYFGDSFKVPSSDHFTIARPASADSIQHRLLLYFIKEIRDSRSDQMERKLMYKMDLPDERHQLSNALYEWNFTAYPENRPNLSVKDNSLIIGGKDILTTSRTPLQLYNCSIECDMCILEDYGNPKEWSGIRIRGFQDNINNGYLIYLRNSGDVEIYRASTVIGKSKQKYTSLKEDWVHIRIDAFESSIKVWINGEMYVSSEDKMFGMDGFIYLHTHRTISQFRNLVIYSFTK